ncbi:ATP-binding protein [Candidatus Avelusimicrobium fimicolum]|uniref:ATP-binding protein n=1 Tax=Candidatus Avelusimicrobium fimicolum TaxID=3416216 RepID=UPI003D14A1FC
MKTKGSLFRGLFSNAVFVLILISIVPMFVIGYHLMDVNSRVLKNEISQKQQTVASRLAAAVRFNITHNTQYFSVFVDLHTDFGGHNFINAADLKYLRRSNPSVLYLAALNTEGKLLLSSGKRAESVNWPQEIKSVLQACVKEQKPYYLGGVYPSKDGLFMLMAFPIRQHLNDRRVSGVLVAETGLAELGRTLLQVYPMDMNALIATQEGQVISYNGAPGGLAAEPQSEMTDRVLEIKKLLGSSSSKEIKLSSGEKILVAEADLPISGWRVYVDQPADVTVQLLKESTFHSLWDVTVIVLMMLLFVGVVSYWVIKPITRPLERLRRATVKQRENGDYVVRPEDLDIPNNEIGELAQAFVDMSGALHTRRQELIGAQTELAQMNQALEKRVEERTHELKAATRELVKSERLAAIGQMASIISHEIRNPLAVISNATRLIKMLVRTPDAKLLKQFGIIEAEIKQANSIISEVLGYARTRDLILSTIDLNSYLREILLSYPFIPGITLKDELDPESVRIKVDAEEIKQAIRNIVSNAVEAMNGGGTLTVGTKVGRRVVCIYIADTGPGISEEVRHKMFAPFFTTKARGTGLGLAVVGKAIGRHKGKLFIQSEVGKGTCFQIYLKIYKKPGDTSYGEAS